LLKGSVLSLRSYGDLALRDFTDLDLLVHRGDVFKPLRCSGWEAGYFNDVRNFHGMNSASAKVACQHGRIA